MKNILRLLVVLPAFVFSVSVSALSTDRDQPAEIEADDIEFDFRKGTRTYLDNVLVVQGTLRLKADKVIAIYNDKDLDTATAWGSLARFKQRPDGKEDDVEGWAKKIIVNQKANTLTLIGKAALKQGPDTARGDTIVYNMATDTLSLKGGAKASAAGKSGAGAPKRKMADPFADDGQNDGPVVKRPKKKASDEDDETSTDKNSNTDNNSNSDNRDTESVADSEVEEKAEEVQQQPEPLKAGRSRLIIRPKSN